MKISLILADNKFLASAYKTIFFCVIKSLRVRKLLHHPTKNIVILNFHRLGDSVFTLPSLKEILKYFNTNIYLFCFEETKPIFESIFEKESVITFFKFDFHFNNRIAGNAVRKKLKQINPEKVIDLTGSTLSASVLITSTARDIIGLNEEYYKSIYTKFTPLRTRPHIMDIYLDVIRMIIPDIDNSIKEFNSTINKGGYLLVHPFAGWTAKEWNLVKFIKLAEQLETKYRVIVISEAGKLNEDVIGELFNRDIELVETKNIYELMNIIKKCAVFISNDSGPLYIANMLGIPTFTVYGPTNPQFSLPYGKNHSFIQRKLRCSPEANAQYCFTNAGRNGCPSNECMHLLDFEEVFTALTEFLVSLGIYQKDSAQSA